MLRRGSVALRCAFVELGPPLPPGLLCLQEGRNVEVCNSFEMNYKEENGAIKIDMDYYQVKAEQCESIPRPASCGPRSPARRLKACCVCVHCSFSRA